MRPEIARGRDEFEAACRRAGVRIVYRRSLDGAAGVDGGAITVWVPVIRGHVTLATALHELGHCVLGHVPVERCRVPPMAAELAAWGYVRQRFDELGATWTPAVGGHAVACLATRSVDPGAEGNGRGEGARVVRAIRLLRARGIV